MPSRLRLLQVYLSLMLAVTLALTGRLFADAAAAGFSAGTLALLVPVFWLLSGFGWLTWHAWRSPKHLRTMDAALDAALRRERLYAAILLGAPVLILLNAWLYQIGTAIRDSYFQGYFSKAAPFLLWMIAAAALTLICARLYRFGRDLRAFRGEQPVFRASGTALLVLAALAGLMALTGLGLAPDAVSWGVPNVPLLPGQVLLLLALTLFALAVEIGTRGKAAHQISPRVWFITDSLIFILIWLIAIAFWQAQPLTPTYFSPRPVAPNYEFYPYSDAANYDISAQEMLFGTGFGDDVRRPLYSFFLALAQWAGGIGYDAALHWQIPLLALIPPLLFLLGKGLHSRLAGGLLAGLATAQEMNAIRLGSVTDVSHAKLLMSDLPTALGVIAFAVVLTYWWLAPRRRAAFPLLAGGILGLTMLVRIQVAVLLPAALLPLLIAFWNRKRQAGLAAALMLAGLGLALFPWMWRNKQVRGSFSFSEASQTSQIGLLGMRYSLSPDWRHGEPLPGESGDAYSRRMLASAQAFIAEHPLAALEFIGTHWLHNQISTFLTLPPSYASAAPVAYLDLTPARTWAQCCSLAVYVRHLPYWKNWDGRFPRDALLPVIFNLLMLAAGIGSAWSRRRGLGLLPLWLAAAYALGNALVRTSGWRFNLPVAWAGLLYYALGLVQLLRWGAMYFLNRALWQTQTDEVPAEAGIPFPWERAVVFGALILAVGVSIPAAEAAFLRPLPTPEAALGEAALPETPAGVEAVYGRALYPRFYPAGEGITRFDWPAFSRRNYPRLGFYLIGDAPQDVVFPLDAPPTFFPHGADLVVLGCPRDDYLEAQAVFLLTDSGAALIQPAPLASCDE